MNYSVPDQSRLADIDRFVRENEDAILRDMARLVAIPSTEGAATPEAPFGPEARQALDCALAIASELGLQSVNCGNRIGYASVGEDDGRPYLATITHVDVVPAGDGWTGDPFTLRERDGYLIGRGIVDDKGPSVLCLYALKYLQESGLALKYPVRAILGSNEETGMGDVTYYNDHCPAPLFCFSPDANFPLINGEKGIYHGRIISRHSAGNVLEINGGLAANAVAAKASALVRAQSLTGSPDIQVREAKPGIWELSSVGISGHASMPEGTVSAIGLLVSYLLEHDIPSPDERPYFELLARLHQATDGSGLALQSSDGIFTPLTCVGGKITTEDGRITQTIDCRYPTTMTGDKITATLCQAAGETADIVVDADNAPFYLSLDNPAVQTCIDSYNLITGEQAVPYTIGGGTYARHFPNAVAFGPEHPERPMPDFCGPIHGVDEAGSRKDLMEALKIYITALLRLEQLDL